MPPANPYNARRQLETSSGTYTYFDLGALDAAGVGVGIAKLPYSIRVLLEGVLRNCDGFTVTQDDIAGLASYDAKSVNSIEMPFVPGRVVLQDFTGVPCVVDLAAMRDAMKNLGGDASQINPAVPCDLVIDHSVQVDDFATRVALTINAVHEFERNNERYTFLKWGQESLDNFRAVPPATGIVHQVNLEYLARGVLTRDVEGEMQVFPDSLVGTDSHTTMINGLGVVGWGVGGIEAEAVMLGQPVYMLTPEVVGFRLTGKLPEGATATDLVLMITEQLRKFGVVEKFVEFFGPGIAALSLPDRATIANMAPEYGATMGFFPIDSVTMEYLKLTNRSEAERELTEKYAKANHLWWEAGSPEPEYTAVLELDLGTVVPSVAGPKRPQDRIELKNLHTSFAESLTAPVGPKGMGVAKDKVGTTAKVTHTVERPGEKPGMVSELHHGSVVIAAITSCTNTSNPDVMVAAGLVARKARALGLTRKPWVKTSLAPGSKVVTEYYDKANLTEDLDALGFQTVGYGCTTCIGNSGPLPPEIEAAIDEGDLAVASVLSGNRNFEGRVHPKVRANYLASPPLVVAYALAGRVDFDIYNEPLTQTPDGKDVFLKDVWPTLEEVRSTVASCINREQYEAKYADTYTGNETWNAVPVSESELYPWEASSTYIQNPPFFEGMTEEAPGVTSINGARCLALLGDSVTTDHISPAGAIAEDSPAGQYLIAQGVAKRDFNSYGSRRGNDRVMTRGTFANVRIRNRIALGEDGKIPEGGWTRDFTQGDTIETAPVSYIYDAAMASKAAGVPLVVVAGKDYGMGSSRDWAAKGTNLLGVRAAIAESFERIHRSNLVFMGVLPLVFQAGETAESLGLKGDEVFNIVIPEEIEPRMDVHVVANTPAGKSIEFTCTARLDTPVEIEYFRNGGILQTVIRKKLNESRQMA
ncbi:MAG: aconitate hydratase AcnA [Planctomycetota bacterium]|nr:MAG: aconitate hydratase AcnA [Planctomycetota bacterium]